MDSKGNLINIPDLRFESVFTRAVRKEYEKQKFQRWKNSLKNIPKTEWRSIEEWYEGRKSDESKIRALSITKVVLKDVILLPLLQSIAWTSFLIVLGPWLRVIVNNGRKVGFQLKMCMNKTD